MKMSKLTETAADASLNLLMGDLKLSNFEKAKNFDLGMEFTSNCWVNAVLQKP